MTCSEKFIFEVKKPFLGYVWSFLRVLSYFLQQICFDRAENPQEFKTLLEYNIGLTDICKTDYGNDNELDTSKYDVDGFIVKILEYKPKIVCFNGKNAAKVYLNQKKVDYGYQDKRVGESKIFIAPSTSGAANGYWNRDIWKELVKK